MEVPMAANTSQHPPSLVELVLWTALWLLMWAWAILGPVVALLACISLIPALEPYITLKFLDEPAQTVHQKAVVFAVGVGMGLVGGVFLWLRRRGHLKEPLE
jgi:hypothetical protein